jgi:hypothetical protein
MDQGGIGPGENARDLPAKVWAYVQESRELVDLPPLEPWATLWARASEEYRAKLQGRTAAAMAFTMANPPLYPLEYRVAMWSAAGLLD